MEYPDIDINQGVNTSSVDGSNTSDYYYYKYDYDEIYNIPMEEFIPIGLVYVLTIAIGVVGHFLVIYSIARYQHMQNVTNIFLTSLSSADLLLILVCVPIKVSSALHVSSHISDIFHYQSSVFLCVSVISGHMRISCHFLCQSPSFLLPIIKNGLQCGNMILILNMIL